MRRDCVRWRVKHDGVVEMGEVVEEVQFALSEGLGESSQKEPPEQA